MYRHLLISSKIKNKKTIKKINKRKGNERETRKEKERESKKRNERDIRKRIKTQKLKIKKFNKQPSY